VRLLCIFVLSIGLRRIMNPHSHKFL
jgi:hypothetical protein